MSIFWFTGNTSHREVVLKLEHASESPGGLVETMLGPTPRISDSALKQKV